MIVFINPCRSISPLSLLSYILSYIIASERPRVSKVLSFATPHKARGIGPSIVAEVDLKTAGQNAAFGAPN
jgi:hypothetical protein